MFALLLVLGGRLVWDEYRFEVTSPGLGEPQWIYTAGAAAAVAGGDRPRHRPSRARAQGAPAAGARRGRPAVTGPAMIAAALFLCFLVLFVRRHAGRRRARAGRHAGDLARRPQSPGGADQRLYRHRQVSAAGGADVRAGRRDLRPLRRGAAAGATSPPAWSAAGAGSLAAVTVLVSMFLGGISGSGPANAAAVGGAMMGALSRAGYPQRLLGQRDRRRGGDRHPDPALDRADHLFRAGAAGARCRRCSPPA